jgi:drug/metabolite transporter (DMT)-like permease
MRLAIVYGIVVALIWAGQPVVSKLGYRVSLTAVDQTFLRYAVSGLLILPFVLRRGVGDAFGLGWRRAFLLMLTAGPLYSLVLIGGLNWAPASHSALIYPALTPVFSLLLVKAVTGRAERYSIAGLLLLVVGVVLIGASNVIHHPGVQAASTWRGDLLFVLAALMWALYILFIRKWQAKPLVAVGIVQMSAVFYVLPYLLWKGLTVFQAEPAQIALQAVYHGIVVSIGAVTLFNLAIRDLGARASMFTALVPLFGVVLSVTLLGEPATLPIVLGTAAIVAGLVWSLATKEKLAQAGAPPR